MKTHISFVAVSVLFTASIAFGQGMSSGYSQPNSQPPAPTSSGMQKTTTSTTTKTTYPMGVKGYLDQQLATSKDKKFHVSMNGKDVALTPIKVPADTGAATRVPVQMKSADGKIYEIDFVLKNNQVTGASIGKVNGKSPSSQ